MLYGRGKVQRLSRKGVHSSEWKRVAPAMGDDIVWSAWGHAAARNGAGTA